MNPAELADRQTLRYWELFYALVTAAAIVAVVLEEDTPAEKVGAAALLAALGGWYWLVGHRALHDDIDAVPLLTGLVWAGGTLVLFIGAAMLVPSAAWVTPAVVAQTFWFLPLRFAAPGVVLLCFTPAIQELAAGGDVATVLRHEAPSATVFSVMSLLLGIVITKIFEQNTRQARLIESLEASRAEVARLSHEAGTATERERLAREIHDTLAQGFTSIITLTQAAESELDGDPDAARRHLALATITARENLAEARAMVAALTPSALGAGSLEDAVRRHADRFAEETGVDTACAIDAMPPTLPTAAKVVLLRATQEALTNVGKHAAATSVRIRLRAPDGSVLLTVSDDGTGFGTAKSLDGYGLAGMRARAEQIGGTLVVHSRNDSDSGTVVELELPA